LRAKCFDITRHAVDASAQHQPPLLRCDALSTALLHHYFYKCQGRDGGGARRSFELVAAAGVGLRPTDRLIRQREA